MVFMLLGAAALENEKHQAECRYRGTGQNCDRTFQYVGHARISPIGAAETPPREQHPNRDQWRSEQDLQAQWDMSRWAFWSAFAAMMSVFVTGVGVLVVKLTLDATRAAVAEAEKATKLTADAVHHQRQAFARLERPYIYIFGVNQFEIDNDPPKPNNPHVKFTVANYGKTPATITITAAGISTFHEPLDPLIVDYRDDPAHDLLVRPVISPGDVRSNLRTYSPDNMPFRPPRERDVFQLKYDNLIPELTSREFAFVWIRIHYRGPFGDGYATNACWRYDGLTNRLVPWGEDEKYNSMK